MSTIKIDYVPSEKQLLMHKSKEQEIIYGGAKGGGKSKALVMDALMYGLKYAKSRIFLFRESYTVLESTLVSEWKKSVPTDLYSFNESKFQAKLPNGTVIRFRYLRNKADAEKYQGVEMDYIGIDEMTKHQEETIQLMLSCMRSPRGYPTRFIGTCNPGGIGHGYVKDTYILPSDYGVKVLTNEKSGQLIRFIPAQVYDNPTLMKNDPTYVRRLENLPEAQRKAFLYGDWDSFEGQAFSEWNNDIHVVKPFAIPDTWDRFRGSDYGYTNPFCCLWAAQDHDGNVYIYNEVHETGMTAEQQADLMLKVSEGREYRKSVLDSACWAAGHDGNSIADIYASKGLYFDQANKDRLNGKQIVHKWLTVLEDKHGKKHSRIKVFDNCTNLIKTLPTLPMDKIRVEDVDTKGNDHAYDALRYLLMAIGEPLDSNPYNSNIRPVNDKHLPAALRDDVRQEYDWYNS